MTEQQAIVARVCPDCGSPHTDDDDRARCQECRGGSRVKLAPGARAGEYRRREQYLPHRGQEGRDWTWRKLSRRARAAQPFCSDCGTVHDLTADHTPEAWRRYYAGKVIRLEDVDVVCRRCNTDRGPARGAGARERPGAPRRVDECPVCLTAVVIEDRIAVRHDDSAGRVCPASGQVIEPQGEEP